MACLFCLKDDVPFTSREHALPESMGNTELVLPIGVVCDPCNNGVLSRLDQDLCDFGPVKARRTFLGVASKAGKIPSLRTGDGVVEHVKGEEGAEPTLNFRGSSGRPMLEEVAREQDGRVSLQWSGRLGGPRMTLRYAARLSRAILKSALECAWFDHGDAVYEESFDHVRAAVLGAPRDGFLTLESKVDPAEQGARLMYWLDPERDDPGRMSVVANYAGVIMCTDSRLASPRRSKSEPGLMDFAFTAADAP